MKKDFLSIADLSREEVGRVLELSKSLKSGRPTPQVLAGKSVALIFEKPSLRTRLSFELAVSDLGGRTIYMRREEVGLGEREAPEDVGAVLSQYVSAAIVRTFGHDKLLGLAKGAEVPVVNALSDLLHPCQVLADLLTIIELRGGLKKQVVAYVGDGNNIANSWLNAARRTDIVLRVATPESCGPDAEIVESAAREAEGSITITRDPAEAVSGADVVYTDVWTSMGQEGREEEKERLLAAYQVNKALLRHARPDHIVMHCLPAKREKEITSEVLDGSHSVVLRQAENRLHAQEGLLVYMFGGAI